MKSFSFAVISLVAVFVFLACQSHTEDSSADASFPSPLVGASEICPDSSLFTLCASDLGVVSDGETLCTQQLQRGIDSLSSIGGGCLRLTKGTYLSGMLTMKSNVELWLDEGATLLGSTNPYDYDQPRGVGARGDEDVHVGLIVADSCVNVAVRGRGVIDGQGLALALAIDSLHHTGERIDPAYNVKRKRPTTRPKLFFLDHCDSIQVEGLTLRNSAGWGLSVDRSQHIELCYLTIHNRAYWNNDGIDLNDCTHAEIHHCDINAADDGICLKSDEADRGCEDIFIHDNRIASSANAVKFGSSSYGGFSRVRINNIYVYDTFRSAIALETVDGGVIDDIVVDGICAVNTGNPIFVCLGGRHKRHVSGPGDGEYGKARNIVIRNVKAQVPFSRPDEAYDLRGPEVNYFHNPWPSSIAGLPGQYIENVTLENIDVEYPGRATKGMAYVGLYRVKEVSEAEREYPEFSMYGELPSWAFYLRHVRNLWMRNVNVHLADSDFRPAFVLDDVRGYCFENVNQAGDQVFAVDSWERTNGRIQVLVHRGANALAPENTMASADSALVHGADWIEVDVRTTRDGVMFNLHDDELERTTDGKGLLSESTSEYIAGLDCGAWFSEEYRGLHVPTMREMLEGLKGRTRVFFDVKNGNVADLIALVRETGFDGDKSFFWFKQEEMLREFVRLAPDLKIKVNANDTTRLQYWMTVCAPAYVEVHADALTDEYVDYCHRHNIQVMVGAQGENLEDYSKALNFDVDIINLDRPELFEQLRWK